MMLPRIVEFGLTLTLSAAVMTSKRNQASQSSSPIKKRLTKSTSLAALDGETKAAAAAKKVASSSATTPTDTNW